MPKRQDWLDIIEKASELKKGTKIPKDMDVYSLTMLMYPSPNRGGNGQAGFSTGAGADGVVQPGKPVALDTATNPPSVYHEGETVMPFPGGKQIIPANTEQEQHNLEIEQMKKGYPGYATGGTVYDDPYSLTSNPSSRPTNTFTNTPQQDMYQSGINQAFQTTQQRAAGTDPLMENITNRSLENYDTRAAVSDTSMRQSLASQPNLTEGAKRAVVAKQGATYRAGLSGLVGDLSQQSMQRAEAANTELYNMGRTGMQDELNKQEFGKTFGEQQYQSDVARWQWQESFDFEKQKYGDQEFGRMAEDAQTTSFETWQQKYPNATQQDYDVAREYKALQLQGMGIANATASENLLQLQKSDKWNDAQKFLDAGDYENYAALVKSITGRDINTAQFEEDRQFLTTMRGLTVTAQQTANDAALLGVSADRLAAFINAVNNGADLDAANQAAGLSLTPGQFSSIAAKYNLSLTAATESVTAQQIANDAAQLGVDASRLSAFVDAVNSGADLATANQTSGLNLTQDQFLNISTMYQQAVRSGEAGVVLKEVSVMAAQLGVSSQQLQVFIDAVNNGADLAAANDAAHLGLTQEQMDGITEKYRTSLEAAKISLDSMKNAYGDQTYNSIQNMIEQGFSLDTINERLQEQGQNAMRFEDYQTVRAASGLGQKEWERGLSAATMLLQTNDPTNIAEAARKLNDLFPGTTFNFDQLITDVGSERFAAGMNDMATLAATFDSWDEAYESAMGMNLLSTLGMDDAGAQRLFQGLKINAIDEEWTAIESSQWFGDLQLRDPDSADLIRNTFAAGLTGELEFDIRPVYNVVNSNGDFVQSFDNITDANTFLGENAAAGYSVERKSNYIYKDLTTGDTVVVNNGTGQSSTTGEPGVAAFDESDIWSPKNDAVLNDPTNKNFSRAFNTLIEDVLATGRYKQLRDKITENTALKDFMMENATPVGNYKAHDAYQHYALKEGQIVKTPMEYKDADGNVAYGYTLELVTGVVANEDGGVRYTGYGLYAVNANGEKVTIN